MENGNDREEFGTYEAAEHELKERGYAFADCDPTGRKFVRERDYTHAGEPVEDVAYVVWASGGYSPKNGESVFVTVVVND